MEKLLCSNSFFMDRENNLTVFFATFSQSCWGTCWLVALPVFAQKMQKRSFGNFKESTLIGKGYHFTTVVYNWQIIFSYKFLGTHTRDNFATPSVRVKIIPSVQLWEKFRNFINKCYLCTTSLYRLNYMSTYLWLTLVTYKIMYLR